MGKNRTNKKPTPIRTMSLRSDNARVDLDEELLLPPATTAARVLHSPVVPPAAPRLISGATVAPCSSGNRAGSMTFAVAARSPATVTTAANASSIRSQVFVPNLANYQPQAAADVNPPYEIVTNVELMRAIQRMNNTIGQSQTSIDRLVRTLETAFIPAAPAPAAAPAAVRNVPREAANPAPFINAPARVAPQPVVPVQQANIPVQQVNSNPAPAVPAQGRPGFNDPNLNRILLPDQQVRIQLKSSDIPIPKYSGSIDKKTPFEFLTELEKYRTIANYTPEQTLQHIVPLALIDSAYEWYLYEPQFQDWNDFCTRFRSEFQAIGYDDLIRRELEDRSQGPDETLSSFIRVIMGFYNRLGRPVPEAEILNRIMRQMHPTYRHLLQGRAINSIYELKLAAQNAQEILKSYATYKLPPTSGLLEPALGWKNTGQANTSVQFDPNYVGVDRQKIHYASVDPYAYYHSSPVKPTVKFASQQSSVNQTGVRARQNMANLPSSPLEPATRSRSNSTSSQGSQSGSCFKCGESGHFARDCKKPTPSSPGNSRGPSPAPKQ